jgi:squalene-hopene cyclase-like protein/prenyltransferase/squalene oxidase-like repeat protein
MRDALDVLAESFDDPRGRICPSYYDTAHVVRAWARDPARLPASLGEPALRFLLDRQNPDGSWGWPSTPRGYRLVPTLAAAVAMCAVAEHHEPARAALAGALVYLSVPRQEHTPAELPDTVAVEYVVPALLEELRERLTVRGDQHRVAHLLPPFDAWRHQLGALRDAVRRGAEIPVQRNHCWELFDSLDRPPPPFQDGSVVCSPAATAAAISRGGADPAAISYLRASAAALDGAQPVVLPLTIFERSWLVNAAVAAGLVIPPALRDRIVDGLLPYWTPDGVGAAPGLAIESDDTASYLLALMSVGAEVSLDCLLDYEDDAAFRTYRSVERNTSVSTNAHILEVLEAGMARWPRTTARLRAPAAKARRFLLDVQRPDGSWTDKWHASPYYATSCAVAALGGTPRRTADWVRDSQRADGSWGLWCATVEETAYALGILARAPGQHTDAVRRGVAFLDEADAAEDDDPVHTPLWHSKEIYSPRRLVEGLTASVRDGARNRHAVS